MERGIMLDQSNQHIADRRAWQEERQRLEAENARLRDALKIIATHNPERGSALETIVILAAMTLAHEQRAFDNGIDAGKRLAECGELPY